MNVSLQDFKNICRICTLTGDLNPLNELDLCQFLKEITSVEYRIDENLPSNICNSCLDEITRIKQFIEKCKKSQQLFDQIIKSHNEISTFKNESQDEVTFNESDSEDFNTEIENYKNILNNFPCPVCPMTLLSSHELQLHVKTHDDLKCAECKKTFDDLKGFKQHLKEHNRKKFVCEMCDKGFLKKGSLEEHMNCHTGRTPYICSFCGEGFKRLAMRARHVYLYHNNKNTGKITRKYVEKRVRLHLECQECGKIFSSRFGFANHQLIHKGIKKFLCNICGKKFITNPALQIHMRVHTGETPFECKDCGKRFKQRNQLYKHSQFHNVETKKSYHCTVCDKRYQTESTFNSHMSMHNSDKVMKCPQCDKQFYHESTLHNHIVDHKNSSRKQCEFCKKYFAQSHLKYHLRTHTGEKPYECNVCGKRLAQSQTLKVHMRIHTGEVPYVCDVCGRGFHDSSNLRRHRKKQHENEGKEEVKNEND